MSQSMRSDEGKIKPVSRAGTVSMPIAFRASLERIGLDMAGDGDAAGDDEACRAVRQAMAKLATLMAG